MNQGNANRKWKDLLDAVERLLSSTDIFILLLLIVVFGVLGFVAGWMEAVVVIAVVAVGVVYIFGDDIRRLQILTIISLFLLLIGLVLLSREAGWKGAGWNAIPDEVKTQIAMRPTTSVPATETLGQAASLTQSITPTETSTLTGTPTVESGQETTSTEASVATPTVTSDQVATSTQTVTPTDAITPTLTPIPETATMEATATTATPTKVPPSEQAATFAAGQHFVTLAVLTATMVLFPWVLLLAFAFQRAPRLYKDLEKDLKALGLYSDPEEKQQDLEKTLTPGLIKTEKKAVDQYVTVLMAIAEGKSTGLGSAPSDIKQSVWDDAVQHAVNAQDELHPLAENERQALESLLRKNIKSGLVQAREDVAAKYARQLIDVAMEQTTEPSLPDRINDKTVWEIAWKKAKGVASAIKLASERIGLNKRFGGFEFLLPLWSMTLLVLVSFAWAFLPEARFGFVREMVATASLNDYFGNVVVAMAPAAIAVITAYLFMVFGLVRRYYRSDITPGGYWEMLNRLIVAFLLGLVASVWVEFDNNVGTRFAAISLGFVAGVFPVGILEAFVKDAESQFKRRRVSENLQVEPVLAQRLKQTHPLYWLDDLDPWDELRLTEEGIIGIQGMATADLAHLLIWTPFSTQQIVDWVDQAILFLTAGAEPDAQYVRTFRKMGLRGASDLIDATRNPKDRSKVVAAAQAVQKAAAQAEAKAVAKDPLTLAQLAALRAQLKVKEAQEQVNQVKDKKKDDSLDATTKTNIRSAVSAVRDAKELIDAVVTRVKAGGEMLAAALDAANSLQSKFKTAGEKANDVETTLATLAPEQNQITEGLAAALKALGEALTGDSDANSQAQALVDALDKIATPLAEAEAKAKEFEEKARAIQKKAESNQADVPGEVGEAENLFNSLTKLAQEAQKRIKADSSLADAADKVDDLVKLLTDESADKGKKLIEELKKKEQWAAEDGTKAKSYGNAEQLVNQAAKVLKQAQAAGKVVEDRRSATSMGAWPPLTMEVLETILKGLERNANLRRIQRYLTIEVAEVLPPPKEYKYKSNIEWLRATSPGETPEQND